MKKITYILLSACFLLTSCEDFLNRDPDAKVGSGDYFTDEGSLLTYTNGFIQKYTPSAADLGYGDGYSDIMATEKSFTFLTNASWTPDLQSGWSISNWTPIYNINYFLVHMREAKGLSEATYNHYEGTARFWRAWQYFEKVKTFGAVPWYDEPIDPEDMVALYKPRDSPRIRHGARARRPGLRLQTLLHVVGMDQLRPHQPVHRPWPTRPASACSKAPTANTIR